MSTRTTTRQALLEENADLRARLEEAEEMLRAIRNGEVDALVVGDQIYTLESADAASNRFRGDALTQINEAVIAVDNDHYVTYLNPAAERLDEVTAAEVLGHQLNGVRHNRWLKPEDEAAALAALRETGYWQGETIQTKRSGAEFHVESTISRLRDRNGAPTGQLAVIRDITERKQTEEKLRESEEKYRTLFTSMDEGFCLIEMIFDENDKPYDYRFLTTNPAFERHTGLTNAAGRTAREIMPHEDQWFEVFGQIALTGEPARFEQTAAALGRWFEVHAYRIGQPAERKVAILFNDITPRKVAAEKIRVSEEHLSAVINQTVAAIAETDLTGQFTFVNDRYCELTGYTRAELIGKMRMEQVTHPEDLPQHSQNFQRLAETGAPFAIEKRYIRKDGSIVWVSNSVSPLRDTAGKVQSVVAVKVDITERKQAEERLRAAHDTFRHLVEKSPFGIYAVDADFRLAQVSDGAQKVFSNVRPLLGRDFAEVIRIIWPEPFASEVISHLHHTLATGEPYHAPRTIEQRSDISVVESYDWKIERVMLPDGRFGVVCHFYDLSEGQRFEAELRASEERFRQAADAANALIYEIDLQAGKAVTVYEMERVVGYRPEETPLTSAWWHSLIHPEDVAAYLARLDQNLECGGAYLDEYRMRHKSGRWIIVQDNGLVIKENNTAVRLIGAITDITERKETQEKLLAAEQRLRSEAEAATRAKDDFVALVSHELRNPLNSILGYNRMLQQESVDAATRREYTAIIEANARRQLTLLEDLLDTARMVSGKLKLDIRPLNFARVIADAIDAARPSAAARQISLATDLHLGAAANLTGDPDRLQQVVWNLLSNAIKFTPAGGAVILALAHAPGHLRLTVTDTGKGIAPAMLPYIFDRFRQADSSSARRHGGLGLALAKQLVELHGSTIEACSAGEGQGATFTVTLPLHAAPQLEAPALPRPTPALAPSSRLTGVRILVVDDEAEAREILVAILTAHGAQVTSVSSAAAAVTLLLNPATPAPEVLISDISMPEVDGYELVRQVRRQGFTLPAVAVTAFNRTEDRLRALTAGFQMHVPKPVEPEELIAVLCSLARR